MTALVDVACHLPGHSVAVEEIGAAVQAGEQLMRSFRKFYGLREVRRSADSDLRAALLAAAANLPGLRGNEHRVRYVVYARTVSTVAPAGQNPLEEVCAALGLDRANAFTLTQHGCASGLAALDVAGRLLEGDGDPDALALVFTGETTFSPALQIIPESTVMGEGTAACLVGPDGERDRLLGLAVRTVGRYAEGFPPYPLDPGFLKEHNDRLATVIREAVEAAGASLDELAVILPHNVNRLSWVWTCRALGVPVEKVFLDNVPVTGHCFAADPFINHVHARAAGRLEPGDLYLMASVGLGATFAAAVLRH
jgi:3-oxoacyl-[acyl-carrier-protein] synthase III